MWPVENGCSVRSFSAHWVRHLAAGGRSKGCRERGQATWFCCVNLIGIGNVRLLNMHDPLRPHSHEPNPKPPDSDPAFTFSAPSGQEWLLTPADLATLPQTAVSDCFIVSTGHGTSGPFTFSGVTLGDLIAQYFGRTWEDAEIVSADGFGNRSMRRKLCRAPNR